MKKITIWERIKKLVEKNEDGTEIEREIVVHNHIEDNWVEGEKPLPVNEVFDEQKAWKGYKWIKTFGYLDLENRVLKDCHGTH